MSKKPNPKSTKAEILEAYEELLQEKSALESKLSAKPAQAGSDLIPLVTLAPTSEKPSLEKPSPEMKTTMIPPQPQKVDHIIENLMNLKLGFAGAISDLSEKLTAEATQLQEVKALVNEEVSQLQSLHDLEVEDATLENLINSYETSAKTFAEELSQQREALEQTVQDQQKAWTKEQEEHRRILQERNTQQSKSVQRELKEYQYRLELERQQDQEIYEQTQKALYDQLSEVKETQEKIWKEREQQIAEREKQFAEAKQKVEAMPQEKEDAIRKAREEGKGIAYYQAKVKADLHAKDVEGQKNFYALRIQSLEETIKNQESRLVNLSKQLDSALKQVQDLAVKAIEGASNVNSSQVLKEIAMEQAKQLKTK